MSDEAAQIIDHFVLRLPAIGDVTTNWPFAASDGQPDPFLLKSGHERYLRAGAGNAHAG